MRNINLQYIWLTNICPIVLEYEQCTHINLESQTYAIRFYWKYILAILAERRNCFIYFVFV